MASRPQTEAPRCLDCQLLTSLWQAASRGLADGGVSGAAAVAAAGGSGRVDWLRAACPDFVEG